MDVTELISNPMFDGNANGWVSRRDAVPGGAQDNFGYTSGTNYDIRWRAVYDLFSTLEF